MAIAKNRRNKQLPKPAIRRPIKVRVRFKRGTKKYSRKSTRKFRKRNTKTAPAVLKPPTLPLNIDFYNVVDGVYTSYWAGKLISTLQRDGKKKTIAKYFYKAAGILKLSLGTSPLLLLLETLDKIKPTFRLRNRIVRRSIIKEYPIVVLRPRQLILAVHWLKEEIRTSSGVFGASLGTEIAGKLLEFKLSPRKNNLVKKRNEYTGRTIKAQFNIRYNFK